MKEVNRRKAHKAINEREFSKKNINVLRRNNEF